MGLPTFNAFSLQDDNFITERIVMKGYADRETIRGKISRREGIKLLSTDFGEKEITVEGRVIADSASELQSLLDNMKKSLTTEEADLIIELNRTFKATTKALVIPDEHYNLTTAPFEATFICSNPFAEGSQLTAVTPVTSGIFTFSGQVNISGSLFARPILVYTPGSPTTGKALITTMTLYHVSTGLSVTVSGFNSGSRDGLLYQNAVTINLDDFSALEGTGSINISGGFPKWEPGVNNYTVTVSGRFPGGSMSVIYNPRYL